MTLQKAEMVFINIASELSRMCPDGSAWVFLCGAATIDYLCRLAKGSGGRANFISF
jgi:hypothetical protein